MAAYEEEQDQEPDPKEGSDQVRRGEVDHGLSMSHSKIPGNAEVGEPWAGDGRGVTAGTDAALLSS